MNRLIAVAVIATALLSPASAGWVNILSDPFEDDTTNLWTYAGVTNASGQPMLRRGEDYVLECEWDQSNHILGYGNDPYVILPSSLTRPLGRILTDQDTFRFGATLNITTGSVPDTVEYHQVAPFGLYHPARMGADRAMADNFSGNTTLVRDGSDFIEFDYFVGNNSLWGYYPSSEVTIGAHIDGLSGDYYFNYESLGDPMWHNNSRPDQ